MSGLKRLCKMYGRLQCGDVMWVWDYERDIPVLEEEMTKEQLAKSERKKYETIKKQLDK
jgi:hypothetical protein